MRKALLLISLIALAISLVPFSLAQVNDSGELEECRDGLIIVYLINGKTYTCKEPSTAERWVELGIAEIRDPNYQPPEPVQEEPKSILDIIDEQIPEKPILPVIPFNNTNSTLIEQSNSTEVQPIKESVPEPTITYSAPPEKSNANPLPGTPRKVGQQGVTASGSLLLEVYDKDGNLKHRHEAHNLVVNVGLEALSDLAFGTTHVSGESAGGFTWISVGTGSTAPDASDTDCETQHGSKKQDLSVTNTSLGAVINVSWNAELSAGTLTEICLTDNGSPATGNLFSRQTFTGVPIVGTDTVNAQWTITFADSNGT